MDLRACLPFAAMGLIAMRWTGARSDAEIAAVAGVRNSLSHKSDSPPSNPLRAFVALIQPLAEALSEVGDSLRVELLSSKLTAKFIS